MLHGSLCNKLRGILYNWRKEAILYGHTIGINDKRLMSKLQFSSQLLSGSGLVIYTEYPEMYLGEDGSLFTKYLELIKQAGANEYPRISGIFFKKGTAKFLTIKEKEIGAEPRFWLQTKHLKGLDEESCIRTILREMRKETGILKHSHNVKFDGRLHYRLVQESLYPLTYKLQLFVLRPGIYIGVGGQLVNKYSELLSSCYPNITGLTFKECTLYDVRG